MIIALFALAAALVIGGSAAVVQGFPFVRLESGLAMVIAGASTASAGAILFGLGVVALGLRRLEKGLKARREAEAGPVPVPPVPALGTVFPEPPRQTRPILPGLGGFMAGAAGGAAVAGAEKRSGEPTFEDSLFAPDPRQPELPLPEATEVRPVRREPHLEPQPESHPEPHPESLGEPPHPEQKPEEAAARAEPDGGVAPEDDLLAGPARPDDEEAPVLRPSLDAAADPVAPEPTAPEAAAPDATPVKPAREVVGKYASGGNTYVMYADGSIEAETPRGRFSFASLDELKAFIDAGGEGTARGAA